MTMTWSGRSLRNVRAALPAGGTLLLAEPMSDTSGAEAMADAYFGLYLLAMGSGQPRSAQTLRRMLQEAGFTRYPPRSHRGAVADQPAGGAVLTASGTAVKLT